MRQFPTARQQSVVRITTDTRLEIVSESGERLTWTKYRPFDLKGYIRSSEYSGSADRVLSKSTAEIEAAVEAQYLKNKRMHKSEDVELLPCSAVLSAQHICEAPALPVWPGIVLYLDGFGLVQVVPNPDKWAGSDYKWTLRRFEIPTE